MSLGNVLGAVAPIAAGYFGGPALAAATGWGTTASSIAAGALAGGGIAALSGGDILGGAAMGGLGGMGGGSLASAFNPATAVNAATTAGTTTAVANNALLSPYTSLAPGINAAGTAGANVGMMANPAALSGTAGAGGIAGINPGVTGALSPVPKGNFAGLGMQNVAKPTTGFASKTPGVIDPTNPGASGGYTGYTGNPPPPDTSFMASMERLGGGPGKEAMGMGKLGLTAAPVLSAAFTPEPLSYDDYNKDEKYDPYRTLNLNMDTGINEALTKDSGLRLYAEGGDVGGGVTGAGLPSGTPVAGVTGGGATAPALGSFSEMVASGVHPANAAAMHGMDTSPYLDTSSGMTSYGSGSTPAASAGLGSLTGSTDADRMPAAPAPTYMGGSSLSEYIGPSGAGAAAGMYPTPSGPGITKRRFEEMMSAGYAGGGIVQPQAGGYLDGGMLPGDGMSDDVPANIDGQQEAALSQGEFVIPADVVSHLGNGSSDAGSRRLYAMMDKVRQARTGNEKQGKQINPERYMPA